jgi:hypothetical protein
MFFARDCIPQIDVQRVELADEVPEGNGAATALKD